MTKFIPEIAAFFVGGGLVGFGVGYWRYHQNKVARAAAKAQADFQALAQKVADTIKGTPSA